MLGIFLLILLVWVLGISIASIIRHSRLAREVSRKGFIKSSTLYWMPFLPLLVNDLTVIAYNFNFLPALIGQRSTLIILLCMATLNYWYFGQVVARLKNIGWHPLISIIGLMPYLNVILFMIISIIKGSGSKHLKESEQ